MEIKRLLIVESSEVLIDELMFRLNGTFQIRVCSDGAVARRLLDDFRPDVVLLNLVMPTLDGLALLRSIDARPDRPKTLVTSTVMTSFMEQALGSIHVDYFMMRPCCGSVMAERLCELAQSGEDTSLPESTACNMLIMLNFLSRYKGFRYLLRAVELYRLEPKMSVTGTLYPIIAREFGVNANNVERDIRLAIAAAWNVRNEHIWRMYFYCDSSGTVPRPTNTQFIRTLASRMNLRKVQ